jgi:hypothetical protein
LRIKLSNWNFHYVTWLKLAAQSSSLTICILKSFNSWQISLTSDKTNMHSNSHDIQQRCNRLMASPVSQWLSHNKQLIRTKIHKWHIPYHNSFLGYFPMSYVLQKQGIIFLKCFKGSTQAIYFRVAMKYHI